MTHLNRHPKKNHHKAGKSLQSSILSRLSKSKKSQDSHDSVTIPTQSIVAAENHPNPTSTQAFIVSDEILSPPSPPGSNSKRMSNLKRKRACDFEKLSTLDLIHESRPTSKRINSHAGSSTGDETEAGECEDRVEEAEDNFQVEAGAERSGGGDGSLSKEEDKNHEESIDRLIERHSKKIKDEPSKLISEFHRIEKRLSQSNLDPLTRHKLKLERKRLGGLEVYQTASKLGGSLERGGETGKWCAKTLVELGLRPSSPDANASKVSLLDVGAIDGKSYSKFQDWISTTCIDLNPMDDFNQVLKVDFFKFPIPQTEDEKFDVVGLSLVLNFIGDLKKRGEMIRRSRKFLKQNGKLFIVLPLACLNNSRYLDSKRFELILNYLGFKLMKQHDSAKLTYWFLEKQDPKSLSMNHHLNHPQRKHSHREDASLGDQEDWVRNPQNPKNSTLKFPKVQIRSGPNRNNFCIKV